VQTRTASSLKTGTLVRSAQLDRAGLNKEKRTITVRFSTETPVKRWFGEETLSHDSNAVKLDRMKNGAAVLVEHDTNQRCGITESATITPDKHGEAVVRFARTPLGDQCMNEVEDGTLRWVSVGYVVNRFEVNDKEDEYRAIDWEPLEVSFVGIPADPNARVLRTQGEQHESIVMKRNLLLDATATAGGGSAAPAVITKEDFSRQMDEGTEILLLCSQYQRKYPEVVELAQKSIKDKTPIREFQAKIIEIVSKPSTERTEIVASAQPTRGDRSLGARFVGSDAYKNARSKKNVTVEIPDMYAFRADYGMQQRVNFGLGTSDVSTSTDIGGTGGLGVDIHREFNLLGTQPLFVSDLFSQGTTSGDVVRYARELSFTNAAARVAEAAGKPQSQLDVGVINATVEKTAVYLDVTEEMLSDYAQASSFINSRLAYMVQAKEDYYLLNGSGSSEITGILNFTGIQTLSGAVNTVDQFLKAKAYVEGAAGSGFAQPDAYVINPLDWLSIRLTKDGNGQYLFGGPGYAPYGNGGYSNVGALWGTPVVTTTFLSQGTAVVGAFKMGAQIFRRQGVVIKTTDSDGSKFLSNISTVLAESRFTLACYQPNKFCTITAIPA
jgi:HK97 family phage major capsid protein/HK97 family phage prohead protease